ncbi:MAG: hypothetical protein KAR42_05390 [candidate division Zixibacteria bacterium]|nr:hypothetical protein [candidate division Zixibacteria bacterium]
MDLDRFLNSPSGTGFLELAEEDEKLIGPLDLSRASEIEVSRESYLEAQSRGMSLSELLETDDYDPSPVGSPLDAFERQLALSGVRISGKNSSTVDLFYKNAPALMPEFILREVRKGQQMRPELDRLLSGSTVVNSNRYTPFYIDTSDTENFSLRPVGEGAEIPALTVTEQKHSINVRDYGLALKTSYKALRHRSTAQFKVLLWYIGFKIQTDKIALVVNTLINGDGNDNAASTINSATSGSLTYADLVKLWAEFSPFEMNHIICHIDSMKTILALDEFKDPLAGYRFGRTGELFTPLGATLIRCDNVSSDLIIGLDSRFAVEEVISQPLMVEFDKIIDQKFEEAVISESVSYAKVVADASATLDYNY